MKWTLIVLSLLHELHTVSSMHAIRRGLGWYVACFSLASVQAGDAVPGRSSLLPCGCGRRLPSASQGGFAPSLPAVGRWCPPSPAVGVLGSQWWELAQELAPSVGQAAASFWAALRSRAPRRTAMWEVRCIYMVQMVASNKLELTFFFQLINMS